MNNSKRNGHLLDTILATRSRVGDGLTDGELTQLLRETTLLSEAGFRFLSYSDGMVTLTVPEQDLTRWYPPNAWIAPEKEKVAVALAEEYQLFLHEPVDAATRFWPPEGGPPVNHHHLELTCRGLTVVVAHPHYLKVRLLGQSLHYRYDWEKLAPLTLGPDLLQDLSALYGYAPEGDSTFRTPTQPLAHQQPGGQMPGPPGPSSPIHHCTAVMQ